MRTPPARRYGLIALSVPAGLLGVALLAVGLRPQPSPAAPLPSASFAVSAAQLPPAPPPPAPHAPDRLVIPDLAVDAPTTLTDLAGDDLVIPGDPQVVGRWRGGAAITAARGTTLLAGHVDSRGRLGSLHELHRLRPGAYVLTTDSRSRARGWRVTGLEVRRKTDLPTFAADGPRRLILVTCGGPVLTTSRGASYRDNVIVTAVPAPLR